MNPELKAQLIEAAAEAMDKDANNPARELPVYTLRMGAVAAVEAVLAALTLHSVHQLDAQPEGALVTDRDGEPYEKGYTGDWKLISPVQDSVTALQLEAWGPLHLAPQTGGRL